MTDQQPSPPPSSSNPRLQALLGHEFFAPAQWKRRLALWIGAVLVALAAIVFAKASDWSFHLFQQMLGYGVWIPLVITPIVFAGLAWVTEGKLRATRGSGIPQVIGTLHIEDEGFRARMLALPIAAGKMVLTLIALGVGASIGREGPTVHVGAGLFYTLGRRFGFTDPKAASRFILAGGAAGIAAAFNTPLAGVVFAIEELAGTFEHRFSGLLLTAVIVGGVVSLGIMGNYAYFGEVEASLPLGHAWLAVLLTGIICGLLGGLFARLILLSRRGPLAAIGRLRSHAPVLFAAGCGLALAVGAGLGHNIASFLPGVPAGAVVLLGMSAYLSGVTGAPLTSAVIAMELTDNQDMVIPIMAACLLARAAASLFSPTPVYKDFAERMVQDFERQHAASLAAAKAETEAQGGGHPTAAPEDLEVVEPMPAGKTSAYDEQATPRDYDEQSAPRDTAPDAH
ncbi:MAG: chloride channel protein [Lysobacterales bacterium 13-68-4]|nr:MAG: chloride channel protein [Xanthomonadales bacterium 13-68-4]